MRLAVTRPAEESASLAKALRAQGHEVIEAPLLEIEILPPSEIPQRDWQGVIGTSANSFRSLMQHPQREGLAHLPAACVGPASAEAARLAGFADISMSGGGLPELKALITKCFTTVGGPLLYVSGEIVSGELALPGFEIHRHVAYRAAAREDLPHPILELVANGKLDGVLLYSPRSARIWNALMAKAGLSSRAMLVLHYCLSANVAAALPQGTRLCVAEKPDDMAMLALTGRKTER